MQLACFLINYVIIWLKNVYNTSKKRLKYVQKHLHFKLFLYNHKTSKNILDHFWMFFRCCALFIDFFVQYCCVYVYLNQYFMSVLPISGIFTHNCKKHILHLLYIMEYLDITVLFQHSCMHLSKNRMGHLPEIFFLNETWNYLKKPVF